MDNPIKANALILWLRKYLKKCISIDISEGQEKEFNLSKKDFQWVISKLEDVFPNEYVIIEDDASNKKYIYNARFINEQIPIAVSGLKNDFEYFASTLV